MIGRCGELIKGLFHFGCRIATYFQPARTDSGRTLIVCLPRQPQAGCLLLITQLEERAMSEDIAKLKEEVKAESGQREHRGGFGRSEGVTGFVLILIGSIVLLLNLTDIHLNNWWALFILIPAGSSFGHAWQQYQRHGRMSRSVSGALTGGFLFLAVAAAFLFNLDWRNIWPLFLIFFGVKVLVNNSRA
jgi:hypothetical protein